MKKAKISSKLLLIISLFIFLIIQIGCFKLSDKLESPLQVELKQKRNTVIDFVISNTGKSGLYFFNIDTPMNGHMRPYFRITNENGEVVPYIGMLAAIDLNNAPWSKLEPGEKMEFEVDLLNNYDFSSVTGSYTIDYVFPVNIRDEHSSYGRSNFSKEEINIESNKIEVEIDNSDNQFVMQSERIETCSSSNKPIIDAAFNLAEDLSKSAIDYLGKNKMDDLFNKYYGPDNNNRYNTVLNKFKKILPSFTYNWTYNCPTNCPSFSLAYVSPKEPYKVFLCSKFWYNSSKQQGRIMLHEASHWNITAATQDLEYEDKIFNLKPAQALKNADTYAFFALETKYPNNNSSCDVPRPDWIGDGNCDGNAPYNTAACNYDGGDCCPQTCSGTNCGKYGYTCIDPHYSGQQ